MQIMDPSPANGQHGDFVPPYAVVRRWSLPHGRAVAVTLPGPAGEVAADVLARLHSAERAYAADQPPRRRVTWVGGRLALRAALDGLNVEAGPILATDRGAPVLPPGIVGSVTHKAGALAVAMVDLQSGWHLGVDLELLRPARPGIARKVLTAPEQEHVRRLAPEEQWREVLVRFSMKEAIYKALDPFVRRYVDFGEVSLDLDADGRAAVTLHLGRGEGPFVVEAQAHFSGADEVLTTARVRPG